MESILVYRKNLNEIIDKVFSFKGFLSNYNSNPDYFKHNCSGYIGRVTPKELLNKVYQYNHYYDRRLLEHLITAKIDINLNQTIIFSDWEDKEYKTKKELKKFLFNNLDWYYIEYAYETSSS